MSDDDTGTVATPAPSFLNDAGRALWFEIVDQLAEDGLVPDAREKRLLRDACAEADQLALIESALVGADLVVRGSQGQDVAHPLVGEARRCRTTIAALLGKIGLEAEASSAAGARSANARSLANARWQKRGA